MIPRWAWGLLVVGLAVALPITMLAVHALGPPATQELIAGFIFAGPGAALAILWGLWMKDMLR